MRDFDCRIVAAFLGVLIALGVWSCSTRRISLLFHPQNGGEDPSSPRVEAVKSHALNMRAAASSRSRILRVLEKGTPVRIHSQRGKWINVSTAGGQTGWVYSPYLTGFEDVIRIRKRLKSKKRQTLTAAAEHGASPKPLTESSLPKPEERVLAAGLNPTRPEKAITAAKADPGPPLLPPNQTEAMLTHRHPERYFQIRYFPGWRMTENAQGDIEQFRLQSPCSKLELWILNTKSSEGYSLDQFYIDMVAPLKQLHGNSIIIRPLSADPDRGAEWYRGQAILKAENHSTYDYAMTERKGRFWVLMKIRRAGMPSDETERFYETIQSFSFTKNP